MSATDRYLHNNEKYAVPQSIARVVASPFVVHKDGIRGFIYEVESGRLREVE